MNKVLIAITLVGVLLALSSNAQQNVGLVHGRAESGLNNVAEFVGTYAFEKDDGKFDDLLKEMGVGFLTRKMASVASPKITIEAKDDGSISMKTITTFKNTEIVFKLGQEFEEARLDGKTVKSVMTKEGNKLIQKQQSDPPVTIVREFLGDRLVANCTCNQVVCVREYKKV